MQKKRALNLIGLLVGVMARAKYSNPSSAGGATGGHWLWATMG